MSDVYSHGHHESVLRSHRWRTAENSAAYLLGSLEPGMDLLDVGCGPGTITVGLAERVAPGRVVGLDSSSEVLEEARREAKSRPDGTASESPEFVVGDVYALDFDDGSFHVAHAHQLLQHLSDPVAALQEMGRVLRPGGLLAVRDSDYGAFSWWPADPMMDRWREIYHQVTRQNRAEADAGRRLLGWVQAAGFGEVEVSSSTWTFADAPSREWWGEAWAERVRWSSFGEQAVAYGFATTDELEAIARSWVRWANARDGYFSVVHGEVLARA